MVFFSPGYKFLCNAEFDMLMVILRLLISRKANFKWEGSKIWVRSEFYQLKGQKTWKKEMLQENIMYYLKTILNYELNTDIYEQCKVKCIPKGSEA